MLKTSLELMKDLVTAAQQQQHAQGDETFLKSYQQARAQYSKHLSELSAEGKSDTPDVRGSMSDSEVTYKPFFTSESLVLDLNESLPDEQSLEEPGSKKILAQIIKNAVLLLDTEQLKKLESPCRELINTTSYSQLESAELHFCLAVILTVNIAQPNEMPPVRKLEEASTIIKEQCEFLEGSVDQKTLLVKAQFQNLQGRVLKKLKKNHEANQAYLQALDSISNAIDQLEEDEECSTQELLKLYRMICPIFFELHKLQSLKLQENKSEGDKINSPASKKRKGEENLDPNKAKRQKTEQKVDQQPSAAESKANAAGIIGPDENPEQVVIRELYNAVAQLVKTAEAACDRKAFADSIGACFQAHKYITQFAKDNNHALDEYCLFVGEPKNPADKDFFQLASRVANSLLTAWQDSKIAENLKSSRELSFHLLVVRSSLFNYCGINNRWEFLISLVDEYIDLGDNDSALKLIDNQLNDGEFMRTDNTKKCNLLYQKAELLNKQKSFDQALLAYQGCAADASFVRNHPELGHKIILLQPTLELNWNRVDEPLKFIHDVFRSNRILDLVLVGISFSDCKKVLEMLPQTTSLQTLTINMNRQPGEKSQFILMNHLLWSLTRKKAPIPNLPPPKKSREMSQSNKESKAVINQSLLAVHLDVSLNSTTLYGNALQQQTALVNEALTRNFGLKAKFLSEEQSKGILTKLTSIRRVGGTEMVGFKFYLGNTTFSHLVHAKSVNTWDVAMPDAAKARTKEVKSDSPSSTSRMMMHLSPNNSSSSSSSHSNSSNSGHVQPSLPKVTKGILSKSTNHKQKSKQGGKPTRKSARKPAAKKTLTRQALSNSTSQFNSPVGITSVPNQFGSGVVMDLTGDGESKVDKVVAANGDKSYGKQPMDHFDALNALGSVAAAAIKMDVSGARLMDGGDILKEALKKVEDGVDILSQLSILQNQP